MARIDDIEYPDLLMTADEMARSLKIGSRYLRKLEQDGLPYFQIGTRSHRYDPIAVWKWFQNNIKNNGGKQT